MLIISRCLKCLSNIVQSVATSRLHSSLRSALSTDHALLHSRTKFGERAFSYAGSSVWNTLPYDIHAMSDSVVLEKEDSILLTHQVWRACFLICWFLSVEYIALGHPCYVRLCSFRKRRFHITYAPSLASVLSHMLVPQRGIHCPRTSMLCQTL